MALKTVVILGLLAVLIVSVAGCTSPTSSSQAAGNTSQAASTTANITTSASTSASATPSATPTPSIIVTPVPTIVVTPTPTATPTPAPIPTEISWQVIPVGSQINTTTGVSWGIVAQGRDICANGLTASVSVEGGPSGMATAFPAVSGCDVSMVFNFPTAGMSLGQHAVTVSFAGNAQYGPSTATAYINVVNY